MSGMMYRRGKMYDYSQVAIPYGTKSYTVGAGMFDDNHKTSVRQSRSHVKPVSDDVPEQILCFNQAIANLHLQYILRSSSTISLD